MKVISFLSNKGGTGKTMAAVNTAAMLARHSKVLFVDTDPQANSTDALLYDQEVENSIFDFLRGKAMPDICMSQVRNIDVIPAKEDENYAEITLGDDKISTLLHLAKNYDFVIIDTAPAWTKVNQFVLAVSDHFIIVSKPDKFSYKGTVKIIDHAQHSNMGFDKDKFLGTLLNFCKPFKQSKDDAAEFKDSGIQCFESTLSDYKDFSTSMNDYKFPVTEHFKYGKAAQQFQEYFNELMTKIVS